MHQYLQAFLDSDKFEIRYRDIGKLLVRTPILTSPKLDSAAGCSLFFKAENLQKSGSFKMRGVTNAIMELEATGEEIPGVCTHSSGNHGHALGWAASVHDIRCAVVMPDNAPQTKRDAVVRTKALVVDCPPTLQDRIDTMQKIQAKHDLIEIHPSNQPEVILGQGSAAWEMIEELRAQSIKLDWVVVPTGGGGLLAGTCFAAYMWNRMYNDSIKVCGAEPEGADDAARSLAAGSIQSNANPQTICDGLRTQLGDVNFPIIQSMVHSILTVSDEDIIQQHQQITKHLDTKIEYNSAPPLAVVRSNRKLFRGQNVGIILTGNN